MITIKEEDQTLGLRILGISVGNPDMGIRIVRNPNNKMVTTQIGTEIRTSIDSISQIDQATFEPTDQTAVNKLIITSMTDHQISILNTTETFHRATI